MCVKYMIYESEKRKVTLRKVKNETEIDFVFIKKEH